MSQVKIICPTCGGYGKTLFPDKMIKQDCHRCGAKGWCMEQLYESWTPEASVLDLLEQYHSP